jgi:hypothetical protein
MQNEKALTIREFQSFASLGRTKIYDEIKCGRLVARKVGRKTLILAADARAYLESLPRLHAA